MSIYSTDTKLSPVVISNNYDHFILDNLGPPRRSYYPEDPPVISVLDGKGELNFTMTAYPAPEVKNTSYLGATLNDRHGESLVNRNVSCSGSSLAPSAVICSIILNDLTHKDKGFYRTVFGNSLGELSFTFFVDGNVMTPKTCTKYRVTTHLSLISFIICIKSQDYYVISKD